MCACRLQAVGRRRQDPICSCLLPRTPPARMRSGSWDMHSGTLRKMDIGAPRSHNLPGRQEDTGETRSSKKLSPISLGFGPLETHFKLLGDKETRFRRKVLPQGAPGEGRVGFSEKSFYRNLVSLSPQSLNCVSSGPHPQEMGDRLSKNVVSFLSPCLPRKLSGLGPPTP